MHRIEGVADASDEICRCPQCSFDYAETMNTKGVAAIVYGMVALLMSYVMKPVDDVASFALLLTAIFAFFYFGMSQIDVRQRRGTGHAHPAHRT